MAGTSTGAVREEDAHTAVCAVVEQPDLLQDVLRDDPGREAVLLAGEAKMGTAEMSASFMPNMQCSRSRCSARTVLR